MQNEQWVYYGFMASESYNRLVECCLVFMVIVDYSRKLQDYSEQ